MNGRANVPLFTFSHSLSSFSSPGREPSFVSQCASATAAAGRKNIVQPTPGAEEKNRSVESRLYWPQWWEKAITALGFFFRV
jgi:hypothetical protein